MLTTDYDLDIDNKLKALVSWYVNNTSCLVHWWCFLLVMTWLRGLVNCCFQLVNRFRFPMPCKSLVSILLLQIWWSCCLVMMDCICQVISCCFGLNSLPAFTKNLGCMAWFQFPYVRSNCYQLVPCPFILIYVSHKLWFMLWLPWVHCMADCFCLGFAAG